MTVPSFVVRSDHPRWTRLTRAEMLARVTNPAGWGPLWTSLFVPAAITYHGRTATQNATVNDPQHRLFLLALAGWLLQPDRATPYVVQGPSGPINYNFRTAAINAAITLCGIPDGSAPTNVRHRLLALGMVFTTCFADLTDTEKNTIAGEVIAQAQRTEVNSSHYMDGYSGDDQMTAAWATLCTYGWGTFPTATWLNRALEFWYGAPGGEGRIEMPRWSCADGGHEKGGWYAYYGAWGDLMLCWILSAATSYNAFAAESWLSKAWEFYVWSGWTGGEDKDFEAQGDTARTLDTGPGTIKCHFLQREVLSILAGQVPAGPGHEGGRHLRWILEQWNANEPAYADNRVMELAFLDIAAVAPVAPAASATPPASKRFFSPPGMYYHRWGPSGHWNYDNSTVARFSARSRYWLGHAHFDSGSLMIRFKGDRLLLAPAGRYDSFTLHHRNALERSWLQSLSPLVHDPAAVYTEYGDSAVPDGGQQFKKYFRPSVGELVSTPGSVRAMLEEASGEAWIRCRETTRTIIDADTDLLFANIEAGYRRQHTDPARCPILEVRVLFISPTAGNGLSWPAYLYYARIRKANATWKSEIPLHHYNEAIATARGYTATGLLEVGRLWVDIRDRAAHGLTYTSPGSPLDALYYGPDQFRVPGVSGLGTNYPPTGGEARPPSRYAGDCKRHSVFITKNARDLEEHYVILLLQGGIDDPEPAADRAWIEDQPEYYGIAIGEDSYLVHRTGRSAIHSTGAPPPVDTTPPAEVADLALSPRRGRLVATYTCPADSDFARSEIWIRTSGT